MSNLVPRSKCCATAAIVLLLHGIGPSADSVRYNPVAREVVEARLRRYGGNNRQREAALKKMFAEAGCEDQYVSAQAVRDRDCLMSFAYYRAAPTRPSL
jgi:hypothetical protein